MKKFFVLLMLINLLFAYNVDELKKIINSNSPKIDKILHSKDAVYLLETAIFLNRFDLIKKAKKVNLQIRDKEGNTLLHLAAFLNILNSKLKGIKLYKYLKYFER